MSARAARAYRSVYIASAPQSVLLDALYARLIADIDQAKAEIAAGDILGKATTIAHALAIVATFEVALDPTASAELCTTLGRLYGYVRHALVDASGRLDVAPLDGARAVVVTLRDSFQQAAAATR